MPGGKDSCCLFVYGTLKRGFPGRWSRHLWSRAHFVGEGAVPGILYDLGAYPAFVDAAEEGALVWGEVAELGDEALLGELDLYEGSQYDRVRRAVQLAGGGERLAWIYRFRAPLGRARRIPGGRWPVE